jgi:Domain of unknown function (DUF927)
MKTGTKPWERFAMPLDLTYDFLVRYCLEDPDLWFYGLARSQNGQIHQQAFQETQRLVDWLHDYDNRQWNAYFGLHGYGSAASRKASNVILCSGFPIDVDAGEGKSYADADEAKAALHGALELTGLPLPVIIGSGHGIHGHLLLTDFVEPKIWRPIAAGVRDALVKAGLKLDPARSVDLASVMRAPGVNNWKNGVGVPVTWDGAFPTYPLTEFERFAVAVPERRQLNRPAHLTDVPSLVRLASTYDNPTADEVADHCGQLAAFRKSGNHPEPLWHGHAGVHVRLSDGEAKFHQWSQNGFASYRWEEAQKKLDEAKKTSGPTTCARFHDLNPGPCDACPHWGKITTPLDAPRQVNSNKSTGLNATPPKPQDPVAFRLCDMTGTGLEWEGTSLKTAVDPASRSRKQLGDRIVSEKPFCVSWIGRNENTRVLYAELTCQLPDGRIYSFLVPNEKLYSITGGQLLASHGLYVRDWALAKKALTHMSNQLTDEGVIYIRMGWKKDGSFLLGRRLIGSEKVEAARIAPALLRRASLIHPVTGGSLAAWCAEASKLFQKGLEQVAEVVLASLTAPLMALWGADGGILLHLVSQSAKGKTLSLELGASVWGGYDALRLTSNDTPIAKVTLLGMFANLPAFQDELVAQDPVLLTNWIRIVTEGRDRSRGTQDGGLNETEHHWSTVLISASNQSCRDLLDRQGSAADAMLMRLIELPFDTSRVYSGQEMEAIKVVMQKNAGHAGQAYIKYISQPGVAEIIGQLMDVKLKWLRDEYKEFKEEHRFYLRYLAAHFVASEIAVKLGLMAFDPERMTRWMATEIINGLDIADPLADEVKSSPEAQQLIPFFQQYNPNLLVVKSGKEGLAQHVPTLEPQRGQPTLLRHEISDNLLYVDARTLERWAKAHGFALNLFLTELRRLKIVAGKKVNKNLAAGTASSMGLMTDCYIIRLSHLNREVKDAVDNVVKFEK